RERRADDAPLLVVHRRGLAQLHRPREVAGVAGIRRNALVAHQCGVVDRAVAIVVEAVAGRVERTRVHLRWIAALGRVAAVVAGAGREAVAVGVDVFVDHAVAVVVDAVGTVLGERHDLTHALRPQLLIGARARTGVTRSDTLGAG